MPGQTTLDHLPTMLDTDALALVAQAIRDLATAIDGRNPKGSTTNVTTNASGDCTIAHGLGRAPVTAVASSTSSASAFAVQVTAMDATNITIRVKASTTGAAYVGAIALRWLVM